MSLFLILRYISIVPLVYVKEVVKQTSYQKYSPMHLFDTHQKVSIMPISKLLTPFS